MTSRHHPPPDVYGLMAEFHSPAEVVEAAHKVRAAGYRKVDAYSPYPIEALSEALHFHTSKLPLLVLIGGVLGLLGGFALEYWAAVIEYPMNVGGRPYFSWPTFIPPAYETTILMAALTAVLGMLALNGLPEPYHPVFNVPNFALASRDRFFLCIEAVDPKFDRKATRTFLEGLPGATDVTEVGP
jgi:ActD protein